MTEPRAGTTSLVEADEAPRTLLPVVGFVWLVALVPGGLLTVLTCQKRLLGLSVLLAVAVPVVAAVGAASWS